MKKLLLVFTCLVFSMTVLKGQTKLSMKFVASDTSFKAATLDYEKIWKEDGDKIVKMMEEMSGLKFMDTAITVIVFEGISESGYNTKTPMKLRASYSYKTKKATIIHELGHRLHFSMKKFPPTYNDHVMLFLYLYDVWVTLYGKEFADEQVLIEGKRGSAENNYKAMWAETLSLTEKERADKLKKIVKEYK